ncbi:MAG: hypothetical protein H6636_06875 [Anaerolineales bacterium]|nr:hypothetical protein [Anaerolineales bacterium]
MASKNISPDDKLLNFFQRTLDVNHAIYGLGIDVLAAYSPLLATLIPAYMIYRNTTDHLAFPTWIALAAAIATEVLGISAVHTTISFWQYNNALTRKGDLRSPFWIALGTSVAYIAIVLIVNTVLDAAGGTASVKVIASGTLSLLSLVGALIVAVRAQHALRLTGQDPATVQKQTDTERELREKLRDLNDQVKTLNTANQKLNTQATHLNTENERLNILTTELNTANETLNTQVTHLNTENQRLNTHVSRLNVYRTIFNADLDAAERVRAAHAQWPDASQNALSQILNIPKATLNNHWPQNGHHRTSPVQE